MKPSCQPYFTLLSPFVDGELATADRVSVERHIAACQECSGRVADFRAEAGLVRVGMEMLTDGVDFSGFAQGVLSRITPERPPFFERLRLSWSEMFNYQRGPMVGALSAAVGLAVIAAVFIGRPTAPEGYANQKMALHSVTTDEGAHVAPVVMQTDNGDSIIWVVDHAHVKAPGQSPDAARNEVDSGGPTGQKSQVQPNGGEL